MGTGSSWPNCAGRAAGAVAPQSGRWSNVNLLGQLERAVDLDAEVPDRAL
jgi:hypothetical protein